MIEVLPVGTAVLLGPADEAFPGRVEAVPRSDTAERPYVTYEVVWWDGRSRQDEWLERWQFALADGDAGEAMRIGFGREG